MVGLNVSGQKMQILKPSDKPAATAAKHTRSRYCYWFRSHAVPLLHFKLPPTSSPVCQNSRSSCQRVNTAALLCNLGRRFLLQRGRATRLFLQMGRLTGKASTIFHRHAPYRHRRYCSTRAPIRHYTCGKKHAELVGITAHTNNAGSEDIIRRL